MMKMGIGAYNAECRAIVMRYSNEWQVGAASSQFYSVVGALEIYPLRLNTSRDVEISFHGCVEWLYGVVVWSGCMLVVDALVFRMWSLEWVDGLILKMIIRPCIRPLWSRCGGCLSSCMNPAWSIEASR